MTKIFVTVGTHPQQFDRLLREIDILIETEKIEKDVFCQTGYSTYEPKNYKHTKFLSLDEFRKNIEKAELVITHAGEGNIGLCKNLRKKMIVVPRKKEFKEHTNNHQLELAEVAEQMGLGLVVWALPELEEKIKEIKNFNPSNVKKGNIVEILEKFVKEEFK